MDYGARWYDASIGRWEATDPLADHPNQVDKSPYAYTWNNPILLIDYQGLYPIIISIKSYAPFRAFGPRIARYKGDDRDHSLCIDECYRTAIDIHYDTETQTRGFALGRSYSVRDGKTKGTFSKTYVEDRTEENNKLDVHSYGHNADVVPGSWDIDLFTKLTITIDGDISGDHILNIVGTISGDNFPNHEAIVTDSEGNSLWLGNFTTSAGRATGPTINLAGENEGDVLIDVNISILVNGDGVFQGVKQGDEIISIEDWNKQFE